MKDNYSGQQKNLKIGCESLLSIKILINKGGNGNGFFNR